jgi:SAM-dependent methyltransferase
MPEPINFAERVWLDEYIDGPCSYEELRDCLRHLAFVNRLVFAHRPILQWIQRVASSRPLTRPLHIVDVGCGYGDMLRRIESWAAHRDIPVELTGVDINANGLRAAREATPPDSRVRWIHGDATSVVRDADLITTCGVTHHMTEPEIVSLLTWMERTARVSWFICDLHRRPVPYRIFDLLTRFGGWHRFIRPDGLCSIRRSFVAEDWQHLCSQANLDPATITIAEYKPARLCVERPPRPDSSFIR